MALNAYLKLKGQKSGEIKGSVTQKGREGKIMVIAVSHEVVSPRDAASGLPTGKRMHKPFVITKELDKSSPLLYNVLTNNENIPEWELQFWQPSATGAEKQHYTIKLTNAIISSVSPSVKSEGLPTEVLGIKYSKVVWNYKGSNTEGKDNIGNNPAGWDLARNVAVAS